MAQNKRTKRTSDQMEIGAYVPPKFDASDLSLVKLDAEPRYLPLKHLERFVEIVNENDSKLCEYFKLCAFSDQFRREYIYVSMLESFFAYKLGMPNSHPPKGVGFFYPFALEKVKHGLEAFIQEYDKWWQDYEINYGFHHVDNEEYQQWVQHDGGMKSILTDIVTEVSILRDKYESLQSVAYQLERGRVYDAGRPRGMPKVTYRFARAVED